MTAKFKWALFGLMLIVNNEIFSWAILTLLVGMALTKFLKEVAEID